MNTLLTRLIPFLFLTLLAPCVPAETQGAYVPFVAVDAERGSFNASTKSELTRSSIGHKLLNSPITSEQLKGAKILLISGPFRTELKKRKEDEIDEKLYSNSEIATINDFVKKGGILIGAGISWTWVHYGNKSPDSFPLNQIGEALNFSIRGQCDFVKYDRKFFSLVKEPKDPVGAAFSNVEFKGASHKFIHSNKGICGGGAKRGDGYIYIFGHQAILAKHPEFVSLVFLGLPPQKRTIDELVDNDAKESESEQHQEAPHATEPNPEVAGNNNPLEILAQEGPNLIGWVTSPLEVEVPFDLRARISLLREDMLDGQVESEITSKMYAAGAELCANLIITLDKKESKQIEAKLKVAQAKARSPLSNQALEARRNYLMSWPQYEREVRQREVLSEKKGDNVEVKSREVESAWIVTAGELRKALDERYSKFRDTIRKK